jgi:CheY-like chemotaxis protein
MTSILPLVLAAEDEESDAVILRLAFEKARVPVHLVVVRDGQEVVNYLNGQPPHSDRSFHPLPALLILDLKMPMMNGFEVLAWLSTRPDLRKLPVVVLSSSSADSDIRKAKQMGACEYFVKPHDIAEYVSIVQSLHLRWLA